MSNNDNGKYVAVRHRAQSPSVYFGPFDDLVDLKRFADDHDIQVGIIRLTDPANSEPEDWWS